MAKEHSRAKDRREFLQQALCGLGSMPFLRAQLELFGTDLRSSRLEDDMTTMIQSMVQTGQAFFNSLGTQQRAAMMLPFQSSQRDQWHYTPEPHIGINYKQLDQNQRQLADALLHVGLSRQGLEKASTIISLEPILHEIEKGHGPQRDPELYFYTLFGEPELSKPWGWRFEGHHISLNFTLIDNLRIASTPTFFGANPAEVQHGPRKGVRALRSEEDLARDLLNSLDESQRSQAIVSEDAPGDIVSGHARKADPLKPFGLRASQLSGRQAEILMSLLQEYAGNMAPGIAAARMAKVRSAGFSNIHFAWAGRTEHSQGHYYRIQGPSFLIEYDKVQDDANHIHSVWRDFEGDFGLDLLADHYKAAHR